MFTSSYSRNALACRVAAGVYLLVAVGAAVFVRNYSDRNAGAIAIVLAFGMAALIGAAIFLDKAVDATQEHLAKRKAQQRADDYAALQRQVARSTAYYVLVDGGLSDKLANHMVEHDIFTVEAALDIERVHRAHNTSYDDELAFLVQAEAVKQLEAMPAAELNDILDTEFMALTPAQQEVVLAWRGRTADEYYDNTPDYDTLYEQQADVAYAKDANYQDWPFDVYVNPERALEPVGVMPAQVAPLAVENEWPDERFWQRRYEEYEARKQPATVTGVLADDLPWLNN